MILNEILVRKPRAIKNYGIASAYESLFKRRQKYIMALPKNGDKIQITWLPKNNGSTNAYIGFTGTVQELNVNDGSFLINSGHSILICNSGSFNYIKIDF